MADYQNKPLSGVLFKNQKKSDNHPDVRGKIYDENGKEWDVAGWVNTSKSGKRYTSLKISEPYSKEDPVQPPAPKPAQKTKQKPEPETPEEEGEDDLPF